MAKRSRAWEEILPEHVGQMWPIFFGMPRDVSGWIGRIFPTDVGKRVYLVDGVLQVENDEQRDARIKGSTMQPKLSKGYSVYGAQMGRRSSRPDEKPHKLYLRAIGPDREGYDEEGAYWGSSDQGTVWWAADEDVDLFVRANSRPEAKSKVLISFPNARFFR